MANRLDTLVTICSEALKAENEVTNSLTTKVEKYVAAIGVIMGFHIIEIQAPHFSGGATSRACAVAVWGGIIILLAALAALLLSMRVRNYPTFPDTANMMLLASAETDDQASRSIAGVYLDLRDEVREVNQERAKRVRLGGWVLLAGYVISLAGQFGLKFLGTK
jgi:hypothetical protein